MICIKYKITCCVFQNDVRVKLEFRGERRYDHYSVPEIHARTVQYPYKNNY